MFLAFFRSLNVSSSCPHLGLPTNSLRETHSWHLWRAGSFLSFKSKQTNKRFINMFIVFLLMFCFSLLGQELGSWLPPVSLMPRAVSDSQQVLKYLLVEQNEEDEDKYLVFGISFWKRERPGQRKRILDSVLCFRLTWFLQTHTMSHNNKKLLYGLKSSTFKSYLYSLLTHMLQFQKQEVKIK